MQSLERDIFWQSLVMSQSNDAAQKARCKARIVKLLSAASYDDVRAIYRHHLNDGNRDVMRIAMNELNRTPRKRLT
jgi:hypothetical protein